MERSTSRRTAVAGGPARSKQPSLFERGNAIGERFEKRFGDAFGDFLKEAIPYANEVFQSRAWEAEELPFECRSEEWPGLQDYLERAFGVRATIATARQHAAIVAMLIIDKVGVRDVIGIHFRSLLALSNYAAQLSSSKRVELIGKARGATVETFAALVEGAATGRATEVRRRKEISGSESSMRAIERFDQETSERGDDRPIADKVADELAASREPTQTRQLHVLTSDIEKPGRQLLYGLWAEYMQTTKPRMADMTFWEIADLTFLGMLEAAQRRGELSTEQEKRLSEIVILK